jgi:hypothetical protein
MTRRQLRQRPANAKNQPPTSRQRAAITHANEPPSPPTPPRNPPTPPYTLAVAARPRTTRQRAALPLRSVDVSTED